MTKQNTPRKKKERIGTVTSNKTNKTATITVERDIKVPVYGKFIRRTKKLTAHDEHNQCQIGDTVKIIETRPLSKTKRWRITAILKQK